MRLRATVVDRIGDFSTVTGFVSGWSWITFCGWGPSEVGHFRSPQPWIWRLFLSEEDSLGRRWVYSPSRRVGWLRYLRSTD